MPSLKWTPQALKDVQRLHQFLVDKNPDAAKRAVQTIRAGVRILALQPRVGHPAEDLDPEYREWLIPFGQGGYLVLYRIDADAVVLLAVRHGREAGYRVSGA
jgi:plasmid stabilization system protein ParE